MCDFCSIMLNSISILNVYFLKQFLQLPIGFYLALNRHTGLKTKIVQRKI